MIRVGRCTYNKSGKRTNPSYEGFTPIIVLTKSSQYGSLGPYVLKDKQGRIMENIFQFSKVYETVPKSVQRYSRYNQKIIWNWPAQTHARLENGEVKITEEYMQWRRAGQHAEDAIRYPVGFHHRHNCLFSMKDIDGKIDPKPLDYIQSRKEIYLPVYVDL